MNKILSKNESLVSIMQNVAFGIIIIDPVSRSVEYMNEYAAKLFGTTSHQVLGRPCHQIICPEQINQCPILDFGANVDNAERMLITGDGAKIPILKTVKKISIDGQEKLIESFIDITALKEQEKQLRLTQERFALAVHGSHDGIWDWDILNNELFLSLNWKRQLGYEDKEIANQFESFSKILHPEDRQKVFNYLQLYLQGTITTYSQEFRMRHKDGTYRWILARGEALRDSKGIPFRMAGSHTDITAKKEAEEEQRKVQLQLFHSAKLASIGTLAAGMAHEINNPLAILLGHLQLFEDEYAHNIQTDPLALVQILKDACQRISNIIDGLKTYARADVEKAETIDLHRCIEETLTIIEGIYQKENIQIERHFLAPNSHIMANRGKIQQVLMNLLSNAKDALVKRSDGRIKITTRNQADQLTLEIADNGIGIPEAILSKLFDPFFTTKPPGKGTGLGLPICHTIIESFGGSMSVESQPSVGTTLKIVLPARASTMSLPIVTSHPASQEKREQFQGKVLLVDDEPEIRVVLTRILSWLGLHVTQAADGPTAYQMVQQEEFDYIVTDLQMPKMGGAELIAKIKSEALAPNTKFIILTGGIRTDAPLHADAYLYKPFKTEQIVAIFEKLNAAQK